jgi:hypothetical protein
MLPDSGEYLFQFVARLVKHKGLRVIGRPECTLCYLGMRVQEGHPTLPLNLLGSSIVFQQVRISKQDTLLGDGYIDSIWNACGDNRSVRRLEGDHS